MASSFTQKNLTATFVLGTDLNTNVPRTFADGKNTATLKNLRTSCRITLAGFPGPSDLDLRIWGMTLDQMMKLSTYEMNPNLIGKNQVTVEAGDAVSGMAILFTGTIYQGWADFQGAPDSMFRVAANGSLIQRLTAVPSISVKGGADAVRLMQNLASQMGLTFENNMPGPVMLPDSTYDGDAGVQAAAIARDGNFNLVYDVGTMAIFPKGQARSSLGVVPVGPGTGMIGYPTFQPYGLLFRTLWAPAVHHGATANVTSVIPAAQGRWVIQRVDHFLESRVPHGRWESACYCTRPGQISGVLS